MIERSKRFLRETAQLSLGRLLTLTGTSPHGQERTIGVLVLGLTLLSLGACAGVLIWALSLV